MNCCLKKKLSLWWLMKANSFVCISETEQLKWNENWSTFQWLGIHQLVPNRIEKTICEMCQKLTRLGYWWPILLELRQRPTTRWRGRRRGGRRRWWRWRGMKETKSNGLNASRVVGIPGMPCSICIFSTEKNKNQKRIPHRIQSRIPQTLITSAKYHSKIYDAASPSNR